ncbi:DNA polymerase III subunit alpha [Vampirovibrio sp.]|uniref:DNA polymerase III subunit alpha n=1 Tax=Vampirovibrio sp. TaxID=2717857 RepID=UPI0035942A71
MSTPRPFVHLHVHTHYSMLDAATRVPDLVKIAVANNMPAVAITDHGVMYGAVELYNACKGAGLKAIIGADLYVVDGDITDRSSRQPMHQLVLLCKNEIGYKNLVKIVSRSHLEGFYYKPRVNWDIIKAHSEGLIALTGDLTGPVARPILRGHVDEARERAKFLKDVFGEDLYLEIVDHGKEPEYRFAVEAVKIAQELGIELVVTNDTHFSRPGDEIMHNILLCMQQGKTLAESGSRDIYGPQYYIKSGDEMARLFQFLDADVRERALDNTLKIADKIEFKLKQGESILPDYPIPEGTTLEGELEREVMETARERFAEITPAIQERLDFELNIINQMGFPAYFLITADFIRHARDNDIPVGPGRGSAAGSLVAFVLGITDIDPLAHNLLFERFLNPERVSMPDVDIDFCIDRREQVIEYVRRKYGADRVCQIITFGTLAARAALKAVARVMEIPFAESNKLAAMIPFGPSIKLKDALEDGMELKKLYDTDPKVKELVDLALALEGTAVNVGMHAAGVVISKDALDSVVPVQFTKDGHETGQIVSQYPMGDLEKLGLLKMDFLGLRNLTIIDNTVQLVRQIRGEAVDMRHLPLDDQQVYEILTAGDTDGIFQLESGGMKALVKDLKPSVFEDIGALVALYRPGPLNSGMVKQFVDRKHGRAQVEYKHPALEPLLKDTYGTIVYQEQIMQIAQSLAGYSLGQADLLRRAMGKKKADIMEQERAGFLAGCEKNSVDLTIANELFDTMSEFAAYCFNRSHSAAYALVAYQTAYLKAHYPVEYLSALLSSVSNDLEKVQFYILACRKMGLKILPPDINKSGQNFTPDGDKAIRFGMATIKNVGVGVVENIIQARTEKPFASLEDFCERVDPKALNRKTLESLINSGAFTEFGASRKQLFQNVETLTNYAARFQERKITGQASLFSLLGGGDDAESSFGGLILSGDPGEYSDEEIQQFEKELLGFYVSSHPLDSLLDKLPMMTSHTIAELKDFPDGVDVVIGGLISSLQKKITKTNRPIWIGKLEDFSSETEFVMFSDAIEKVGERVAEGKKVLIQGRLQFRGDNGDQYSIILNEVHPVDEVQPLHLFFESAPKWEILQTISTILVRNRGFNSVILNFTDGTRIKAGTKFWINNGNRQLVKDALESTFGQILKVG